MRQVEVSLAERSYTISIADRLLDRSGELLAPYARRGRMIAVSDERVWAAQGSRLKPEGIEIIPVLVPAGEGSKSWAQLSTLLDRLLELGVERSDHILAFGGGMIGDLTGFAASVLKRGCGFVQIPTTLLAQVDSSVGGKTAINTPAGKNMVGTFHQPSAVLIDPSTLDTLSARERLAGYAEVVKYGLISDPAFFAWCESEAPALLAGESEARLHAIETSVRTKAGIVGEDERETSGRRALLNLGHTFGHAFEAEAGFSDRLLHGEAVGLGMALAFRFSARRGLCPPQEAERVVSHLAAIGLPTVPRIGTPERLVAHMAHDKKASAGRVPFILARGIGRAFVDQSVELAEVESFLADSMAGSVS
jgi:3-dehydroquinate synthase